METFTTAEVERLTLILEMDSDYYTSEDWDLMEKAGALFRDELARRRQLDRDTA